MSDRSEDEQIENLEIFFEGFDINDYVFIFDREGRLKALNVPQDQQFKIPTNIKKLFKAAGLPAPDLIETHTLH
jgi:hypothetical protein